eukprot:TRINITY_DN7826_c0_g1_i15.p4 TRINITY_DN7826_c0_g1~~TRINITY_DN7826_c0_g1_i15.p4  ORF type:complete len:319 (-),score=53.25 TRINITY_DN7826_c0_g1_i15:925-1881(-)
MIKKFTKMAYMEKKEVGMVKFWQIGLRDQWVTTRYGSLGGDGVCRTREFEDQQDAVEHLVEAVLSKKESGYELKNKKRKLEEMKESGKNGKKEQEVKDVKDRKNVKAQSSPPRSPNNSYRRKKRGLSRAPPPDTSRPLGFVDPESCLYGDLFRNKQGVVFDCMLVKQYNTSDCYYILQLIENKEHEEYKVYLRWGRVGSAGQCQVLHPPNLKDALEMFEDKFWEKTGCEWKQRATSRYLSDMYRWIRPPLQTTSVQVQRMQQNENNNTRQDDLADGQSPQQSTTQDNDGEMQNGNTENEAQGGEAQTPSHNPLDVTES